MLRWRYILLAFLLVQMPVASGSAGERIALVIGNQSYSANVGPLRNPHNDIALVGKALGEVGFRLLAPRKDATRDDILFAVQELATQTRAAGRDALSFLFYAGHGVAVAGENVLIPTNVESTSDAMLRVRGVRLGEILDILKQEAPNAAHFVVLDACRTLRGQRGTRGFVPVRDGSTGIVIAFSTAPGEPATDDGAESTPYAVALAEEIVKPGRNDLEVFNAVRVRVHRATGGQTPWTNDGLVSLERVVFKAGASASPPPAAISPAPPALPQASEAERAWAHVKDSNSIAALEAFAGRYRGTFYADMARSRIDDLKRQAALTPPAAAKPPASPTPDARADNPGPILAASGSTKRFNVAMGQSVELTSKGIVLSVREPDLQKNSIGVRLAGRGIRWGAGLEFPLAPYGGGGCRLALMEVRQDMATFLLRC